MGIVNVTPDSFSDGGKHMDAEAALRHGLALVEAGADWLDVGGESTRPGAVPVSEDEERARVLPVIAALRRHWSGPISIDTMKPGVARAAVEAGASGWNDVSALSHSPDSPAVAAALKVPVFLMHMKGAPPTMQDKPAYGDVVAEVRDTLLARAQAAEAAGVARSDIWLDPGIGFGKTTAHNLALTARLSELCSAGYPVLYGASRKRMISDLDAPASAPDARLGGSLALALAAAAQGAAMVRVHDVAETVQALKVQAALDEAGVSAR